MQKSKELQKLHASYTALLTSFKNHNIETAERSIANIIDLQDGFWDKVNSYLQMANPELEALQGMYVSNESYLQDLKYALIDKGINPDTNENTLLIGPMEVVINVQEYYIQLNMGRKKKRITDLELGKVVKLVEQTYKKLNYSFNVNNFFKRLLRAYEYANSKKYACHDAKFGYAVSLKDIFDLFTIAPGSNDYKIENFLWDLGRLIDTPDSFGPYSIEYGFSRDVKKMYIIKTPSGESMKASTLTIHKEE
ncbi:MAG: hypothetical protein LHW56_01135 [Candidatus Cloacimonetes bacterium]|jgi:hypothetical protein|nr:hypothetical protein [Candidatus Cloacimonadota bacterium]MDY0171489.1 hypothetical protein [Candidatus Cloacimonadaceae bacterium]